MVTLSKRAESPLSTLDVVIGLTFYGTNFQKQANNFHGRWNGLEHGGDCKTPVTFEPFIVQTSNLQFRKW